MPQPYQSLQELADEARLIAARQHENHGQSQRSRPVMYSVVLPAIEAMIELEARVAALESALERLSKRGN